MIVVVGKRISPILIGGAGDGKSTRGVPRRDTVEPYYYGGRFGRYEGPSGQNAVWRDFGSPEAYRNSQFTATAAAFLASGEKLLTGVGGGLYDFAVSTYELGLALSDLASPSPDAVIRTAGRGVTALNAVNDLRRNGVTMMDVVSPAVQVVGGVLEHDDVRGLTTGLASIASGAFVTPGATYGARAYAVERLAQTGAGKTIAYWDFDAADAAYDLIRGSNSDVLRIAENTGMRDFQVARIKDHVFNATHELDGGVIGRFDAHPDMANAWNRLEAGSHAPGDMQLLQHELFEAKFEGIFRTDYATAHNAANRSGRLSGIR